MIYYIIFTFHFNVVKNIGYICYDDGCHLRRFAQQPHRKNVTATSQKLASLEIVVDKMHIAGHKDPWCLQNCDSRNIPDLKEVNAACQMQYYSRTLH